MPKQITEKDFLVIKEIVESEFLRLGRTVNATVSFTESKFIEGRKEVLITADTIRFTTSLIGVAGSSTGYARVYGSDTSIAILRIEDRLRRYVREKEE